jgi:hypothetical protein
MTILDGFDAGPDRVLVVSPAVFRFVVDDARAVLTNNIDVFSNGYIKDYYGFEVFKSNSLSVGTGSDPARHCLAMTRRALPFAGSITESELFRLESAFATAMRGLYVFGAGMKWENEAVDLFLTV